MSPMQKKVISCILALNYCFEWYQFAFDKCDEASITIHTAFLRKASCQE